MDSEKIYSQEEIQPLMRQGAVFRAIDYGDANEIYWDKEKETFMYKGGYRDSVPETARGALNCYSYKLVRIVQPKRINPWSV